MREALRRLLGINQDGQPPGDLSPRAQSVLPVDRDGPALEPHRSHRYVVDGVGLQTYEWGPMLARETLFCVHGLTRSGRDFDYLGAALGATGRRVIAVDVVGRGRSSRLDDPRRYAYPVYVEHMSKLLRQLDCGPVDWIGTSMGGIIGMFVAAQFPQKVRRLVLNDVGIRIPKAALTRILDYVGKEPVFADRTSALPYLRERMKPFGPLEQRHIIHLAHVGLAKCDDGRLEPSYDRAIALALQGSDAADVDLTAVWLTVRQPVLVLRGAESDLLLADTAAAMASRPNTTLVEFPDAGHAPSLMIQTHIEAIRKWLDQRMPS